jgi:hypothetical protein
MTATTFVAYDPKPERLGPTRTFKATAAILAGEGVAFDASGEDDYVSPAATTLGAFVGVALNSQATVGGPVTVAMDGTILTVALEAGDSAIDAGHWLMVGAVAGTFVEYDPAIGGHAATQDTQGTAPVAKALRNSVIGSGTAASKVLVMLQTSPQKTASA